jgi:S1-C subfamily serine protease
VTPVARSRGGEAHRSHGLVSTLALAAFVAVPAAPLAADGWREARATGAALAFVRVIADVRVEFGGVREPVERKNVELATGSGFVAAPTGLVLTSGHVVAERDPAEMFPATEGARVLVENRRIEVVVGDESPRRVFEAWVAAADPELDLAALQVTAADLPYLPMGDSDAAEPGRPVHVFGFPFGRQIEVARGGGAMPTATVTAGSLSAAREDEEGDRRFLQTDAVVNPGSSGGPMVDEDGYVVGLVRMKLAKGATGAGPGFAVTVNVVKDFLEAHGLLAQLPVGRLRPGVVQAYDWKRARLEAPDGFIDTAGSRLRLELGEIEGVDARVFRLPTSLPPEELDDALVRRGEVPGFVPAPATPRPGDAGARRGRGPALRLGSAEGETSEHQPFRVEYAVLAWKDEVVVARYVGHPDAMAFNLSLVRRSLQSLEATALRASAPQVPMVSAWDLPHAGFAPASFPSGEGRPIPMPVSWVVEPADETAWPSCLGAVPAGPGVSARHPADYTIALRAWRFAAAAADGLERGLVACGAAKSRRRLGVVYDVSQRVVRRDDDALLLQLEAPSPVRPLVDGALDRWVAEVAPRRR